MIQDLLHPIQSIQQGILVWLVVVILTYFSYLNSRKQRHLPPGPLAFPLVGNVIQLGKDARKPLRKFGKLYGDVFSIYLGPRLAIFLNSYDAIREAFVLNGSSFNSRPDFFFQIVWKERGIATANGERWREHKKFLLQTFTNIGMKQKLFQRSIEEESRELVKLIKSHQDQPICTLDVMMLAMANIVCSFLWGRRYEYTDVRFQKKVQYMRESFELVGSTDVLNVFPVLKYLPGDIFKYKKFIRNCEEHIALEAEDIKSHNTSRDKNKPRGYIDAYLNAMEEHQYDEINLYTEDQLHVSILDLFGTGSQSAAATLVWTLYYMLHHKDVLNKVQQEIDGVLRGRNCVTLEDRHNLPFTEATLYEIQRLADVAPLGIPHGTNVDVNFRDFTIPKGTMVFSNLNAVSTDKSLWKDPDSFMPERFLEKQKDGRLSLVRTEYFIPFSLGKRSCPGESLARMELLVMFSTLVHSFEFSLPEDTMLPSLEGKMSTINMPPDVKLIPKLRTQLTEE